MTGHRLSHDVGRIVLLSGVGLQIGRPMMGLSLSAIAHLLSVLELAFIARMC